MFHVAPQKWLSRGAFGAWEVVWQAGGPFHLEEFIVWRDCPTQVNRLSLTEPHDPPLSLVPLRSPVSDSRKAGDILSGVIRG